MDWIIILAVWAAVPFLAVAVAIYVGVSLRRRGKRISGALVHAGVVYFVCAKWLYPCLVELVTPNGYDPLNPPVVSQAKVVFPINLVFHVRDVSPVGEDYRDAMTLAETGLFRVALAGQSRDAPVRGWMTMSTSENCAANIWMGQFYDMKVGALAFAARTGFRMCAVYAERTEPPPGRRLDLWKWDPPGQRMVKHNGGDDGYRGAMVLNLHEGGSDITVSKIESVARRTVSFMDIWGMPQYDPRPKGYQPSMYRGYDPDPVGFVISALGIDQDSLPRQGTLQEAELIAEIPLRMAQVSEKKRDLGYTNLVALSLFAAVRKDQTQMVAAMDLLRKNIESQSGGYLPRVPSDCPTALSASRAYREVTFDCRPGSKEKSCKEPFRQADLVGRCHVKAEPEQP